jgi:3-deoxy-D-manno-octulosonic-acid transferase
MLEAAIYEVPVLIGPRFKKFNEAVELINLGIAFDTSKKETKKVISQLVEDDQFYATVKKRCALYMAQHDNVSENIDAFICEKKLVF